MEQKLIQALAAHYSAQVQKAEANLVNYFKNPAGIGEHPDIVAEMVKLVDDLAAARDGLEVVQSLVSTEEQSTGE